VKDRKKLKDFQSQKFEQYAINSRLQGKHYVVGFDDSVDHIDETSGVGHGSISPGGGGVGGLHL
jgi:hypothetical protein